MGYLAGGISGFVGNPGEIIMVRMQGDKAKPPEKRFNYKHSIDALIRVSPFPFYRCMDRFDRVYASHLT